MAVAETDLPPGQACMVPDEAALIGEWLTPDRDGMELYRYGDSGVLVMITSTGPERAAAIRGARGPSPAIVWEGQAAAHSRAWRDSQEAIVREQLARPAP